MKRFPILSMLVALLAMYHLNSLPKMRFGWSNGKFLFQRSSQKYVDASTERLAGWGTWLRFKTGQDSEMVFRGKKDSYQRLYLRTDLLFQSVESLPAPFESTVASMRQYVEKLRANGVNLVVVPIPTKTSVDKEHTGPLPSANIWIHPSCPTGNTPEAVYEKFKGPASVDLLSAFTLKDDLAGDCYVPWDYHWTSLGIARTAKEIVNRVTGGPPIFI